MLKHFLEHLVKHKPFISEEFSDEEAELEILDESIAKRYKTVPNYFCAKCKFSSKHFESMATHIKAHLDLTINPINKDGNSKFIKEINNGSIFGCQMCCLGFLTKEERSDHVLEIHSIVDFTQGDYTIADFTASESVRKFGNEEKKPRKKSNSMGKNPSKKISNTLEIESNQFGAKTLDPKIDDPNKIGEKLKNASRDDSSILQDETKTKVQITINGENVFLIKIQKHSTNVTLADVKNQILRKSKMYGIANVQMYDYFIKTAIVNGKVGLEEIDEDDTILKLLGNNIEMECWSK